MRRHLVPNNRMSFGNLLLFYYFMKQDICVSLFKFKFLLGK